MGCRLSTGAIIQARLGSSRLPKKVLMPLNDDVTILDGSSITVDTNASVANLNIVPGGSLTINADSNLSSTCFILNLFLRNESWSGGI